MKKFIFFLLLNPILAWCQPREVFLYKETIFNNKPVNIVFKLGNNGTMTPYYYQGNAVNIDSLQEFEKMWPRIRSSNDTVLNSLFSKPIEQLINYQDSVSHITTCYSNQQPLVIYIRENHKVKTVVLQDYGRCSNKLYLEWAGHLVYIIKNSINAIIHYSPG